MTPIATKGRKGGEISNVNISYPNLPNINTYFLSLVSRMKFFTEALSILPPKSMIYPAIYLFHFGFLFVKQSIFPWLLEISYSLSNGHYSLSILTPSKSQ